MSDVRYHINPQTGNVNQCKAFYSCRFKMSEAEHYETKEEAKKGSELRLASENIDPKKYVSLIEKDYRFYDSDNRDNDLVPTWIKYIKEDTNPSWTDNEKENLYRTEKLVNILKNKNMNDSDWKEADDLIERLKPVYKKVPYMPDTSSDFTKKDRNIVRVANDLYLLRKSMDVPEPPKAPDREVNDRIVGLRDAQLENLRKYNDPGYDHYEGRKILGDSVENYFDDTLNRVVSGEEYKPFDDSVDNQMYAPKHDQFMNALEENDQLYMATVFPDKELKEEMERADVSNVTVSSFYNSREYGNAYTVMTPDGDTRTFSVYEHRNTDSIIINGKTNWKGSDVELPYTADSKHEFFAEIPYGERNQAARTLTYFMKNAQNGTLEDDQYLSNNAPRRDWNAILSEQIPGFKDWHEENFPAQAAEKGLNEDEDILRRLDFDNNEEN